MKPIVLKYIYSYFDTLKNKDAVKPFYQILTDDKSFSILSPTSEFSYEVVDIIERDGENITFSFTYERYLHPDTSRGDYERVTDRYTLGRGESIECLCVRQARRYSPLTFLNTPATLSVSYLDDDGVLSHFSEMMKFNISVAVDYAEYLYNKAEYDLAFKLLSATKSSGSALGECFEYGRGTEKDSRRALECYIEHYPTYNACRGIERIIKETEGRDIVCDNAFVCVLSEKLSKMSFAYKYAKALSVCGTSTPGELRRSAEIALLIFLELGRPHNDPFGHPTPNMMELAQYFDMLDGVGEDERPLYYERIAEKDEYDGGYFLHDVYYDDTIVKTLLRHAERGEVLALGAIINQFPDKTEQTKTLADKLLSIAEARQGERGLAYFFLGLYFERVAEVGAQAREYFERALSAGEHFAIIHLAEKYMEEDRERAIRLIKEHHPFLLEKDYRGYPLPYSARFYISLVGSIDVWSEEQK